MSFIYSPTANVNRFWLIYIQLLVSPLGVYSKWKFAYLQKQGFVDVLQIKCSQKFCNIRRKKSVLEFSYNEVVSLQI